MRIGSILLASLGVVFGACTVGESRNDADGDIATINASGGTVASQGASVVIPADTLTIDTAIGVRKVSQTTVGVPANDATPAGDIFAFTPHGEVLGKFG